MKPRVQKVLVFLLVPFCSVFLGAAGWMIVGIVRQARTASWPAAAEATIVSSRVASRSGSKGTVYAPEVSYRYRVGSAWYDSDQIAIGGSFASSGGGYANDTIARFPAGSAATVYVNPAAPAESVLVRGMDAQQWFGCGFVGLFVAMPLLFLQAPLAFWLLRRPGRVGGIRVFEPVPGVWVARDCTWGPLSAGVLALLPGSIVTFALAAAFGSVARTGVLIGWGLTAALFAGAFIWRQRWIARGRGDAVIDGPNGCMILPRGKQAAAESVALAEVKGSSLRKEGKADNERWIVSIDTRAGEKKRIVTFVDETFARAFVAWLESKLREAGAGG